MLVLAGIADYRLAMSAAGVACGALEAIALLAYFDAPASSTVCA